MNSTFLIRAAEFFTHPSDPDKMVLYRRFRELFYGQLMRAEPIERHAVPYLGTTLPALRLPRQGGVERGTLVMHGGFDSFIEEFYSIARYFSECGYEVIAFEGPGQGAALKESGLQLLRWEKPAKAVLDYFGAANVTWLGISMGGWMCFRAAAFEPRISRVIALSIAYDYMLIPPAAVANFARWLMERRALFARLTELKMRMRPQERWGIENLIHITRTDNALDASQRMLEFNATNQHAERVMQDVLILSGAADHFIPLKMHHLQVAALRNARSVTGRIFSAAEHAENHCQVGNIGLALDVMATWAERVGAVGVDHAARLRPELVG
ncbi:alpha/beta hydrolase [Candidatus Gracilibacteria bacterium]|nr:alpha/beta hydrolase [Candidatus Gracilibacteria bacterium]